MQSTDGKHKEQAAETNRKEILEIPSFIYCICSGQSGYSTVNVLDRYMIKRIIPAQGWIWVLCKRNLGFV